MFFNATPAKDARVLFLLEKEKDDSKALLPNGHIHVRGSGSNQYGIWELIGSLNLDTGVLECQRMYVRPDGKPKTPGRRGRPRKSEMLKKRVSIDVDETPSLGPRSTRKRQLSWRKRASLSDDDEPPRRPSTGTGKRGRPRKHSVDVSPKRRLQLGNCLLRRAPRFLFLLPTMLQGVPLFLRRGSFRKVP